MTDRTDESLTAIESLGRHLGGRIDALSQRVDELTVRMRRVEVEQAVMNRQLVGIDQRLDDQSRMIAALVPVRLAAVPVIK